MSEVPLSWQLRPDRAQATLIVFAKSPTPPPEDTTGEPRS